VDLLPPSEQHLGVRVGQGQLVEQLARRDQRLEPFDPLVAYGVAAG
jgi:hypothetical protein